MISYTPTISLERMGFVQYRHQTNRRLGSILKFFRKQFSETLIVRSTPVHTPRQTLPGRVYLLNFEIYHTLFHIASVQIPMSHSPVAIWNSRPNWNVKHLTFAKLQFSVR
ncbi:hypothetical protein Mapa_012190 [Marchantia paleacea]|nr:hypothetical protein Mapa_012190 [Marchantia paleacea]